jgi:uncharacterized protein
LRYPFNYPKMRIVLLSLLLAILNSLSAQPRDGQSLPGVVLSGRDGGLVAGGDWRSESLLGKVTTLMYVDPDEKELNEHVEQALKKENFPRDRYGSIGVVNTAATWKPDSAIRMVLKNKQKEFPESTYVMDRRKVLVDRWQLTDDTYHVLTLDKSGRVIYSKSGRLNDSDIRDLIKAIRSHL